MNASIFDNMKLILDKIGFYILFTESFKGCIAIQVSKITKNLNKTSKKINRYNRLNQKN